MGLRTPAHPHRPRPSLSHFWSARARWPVLRACRRDSAQPNSKDRRMATTANRPSLSPVHSGHCLDATFRPVKERSPLRSAATNPSPVWRPETHPCYLLPPHSRPHPYGILSQRKPPPPPGVAALRASQPSQPSPLQPWSRPPRLPPDASHRGLPRSPRRHPPQRATVPAPAPPAAAPSSSPHLPGYPCARPAGSSWP